MGMSSPTENSNESLLSNSRSCASWWDDHAHTIATTRQRICTVDAVYGISQLDVDSKRVFSFSAAGENHLSWLQFRHRIATGGTHKTTVPLDEWPVESP